jgi:hypothetical protein
VVLGRGEFLAQMITYGRNTANSIALGFRQREQVWREPVRNLLHDGRLKTWQADQKRRAGRDFDAQVSKCRKNWRKYGEILEDLHVQSLAQMREKC